MLSDNEIRSALKEGLIKIEPFEETDIRPAAVSFHLGKEILVPKPVDLIDLKNEKTDLPYDKLEISKDKPFIIHPQQFVLGHTEQNVTITTEIGLIIEGRSTLARLGISVEQSSTIVEPGHTNRPITLEIYNCGPSPVTLYRGMTVAKGLFFKLSSASSRHYDSYAHYANQKHGVGKPKLSI